MSCCDGGGCVCDGGGCGGVCWLAAAARSPTQMKLRRSARTADSRRKEDRLAGITVRERAGWIIARIDIIAARLDTHDSAATAYESLDATPRRIGVPRHSILLT